MRQSEINDLWVGDKLTVKGTSIAGTFEGVEGEMVVIKMKGERLVVHHREVELAKEESSEDEKLEALSKELAEPKRQTGLHDIPSSIDLHIESLKPHYRNAEPIRILQVQMAEVRKFMDGAIEAGLKRVTIVHGKGKGTLKAEVEHLLKSSYKDAVHLIIPLNEGTTEVWLV